MTRYACRQFEPYLKYRASLPEQQSPLLLCVIDTEEEFDWEAEPSREATGVTHFDRLDRLQAVFSDYGIIPCYVADYPVAVSPHSSEALKKYVRTGECEIGAHLHPWVNPPFDETLSRSNMYPGNLPRELEYQKIDRLAQTIRHSFDTPPVAYKAGRYGFGPNTADILAEIGIDVDLSFCPPVDCSEDGGPDYSSCLAHPGWIDRNRRLLEIPVTGSFTGLLERWSPGIYRVANSLKTLKVPGVLARLKLLDRLTLSPEGFTQYEHQYLTRYLYNRGHRVFTWSFHSSSIAPGCSPYCKTEADVDRFLESFRAFFHFFINEFGGRPVSVTELKSLLESKT